MILASSELTTEELHQVDFQELFDRQFWGPLNATIVVMTLATLIALFFWFRAAGGKKLVPTGFQNAGEAIYGFIRNSIVVEVMGDSKEALKYVPYLGVLFTFILFNNLFEVIPPFFFPATSKLGIPAFLALMTWIIFNVQGIAKQGLGHYFGGILFPPGVPKSIYLLLTPIEFFSVFILRPLTLAIRLFANLVAGHVIVTLMLVFCSWGFYLANPIRLPIGFVSLAAGAGFMGFEIFVGFIQAFVFTLLTAVYIGESLHGH